MNTMPRNHIGLLRQGSVFTRINKRRKCSKRLFQPNEFFDSKETVRALKRYTETGKNDVARSTHAGGIAPFALRNTTFESCLIRKAINGVVNEA